MVHTAAMSHCVAARCFEHATDHGDRLALSVAGLQVSYAELTTLAARIGMWLESAAERPPERVGILASRSLAAYAGILGAWWCGASYVPLNPKLPATRLLKIQEITGLDALVVDAAGLQLVLENPLIAAPARVLAPCDRVNESVRAGPREMRIAGCNELPALTAPHPPKSVRADDSAYIMFTSGSTGVPKGVVVTAGNVAHFLAAIEERFSFRPTDRFSQLFELNFDLSVADMANAWSVGASLHVVPATQLIAPARFLQEHELTVWFSVPSTAVMMGRMRLLRPGAFPSLRYSLFCGEPLPLSTVEQWRQAAPQSIIENLYGPTEATIFCLGERVTWPPNVTPNRGTIAIGKPLRGTNAAVIDSARRALGPGQPGELALSGGQVAQGYFADPGTTRARFPLINGETWYLTGDLAYRDDAGVFHHLGRIDNQVKVLGNRVELEEVEAHLREVCGCDSVCAVAWPVQHGSASGIVAFLSGVQLAPQAVREAMRERLPAYMVPTEVRILDDLPHGVTGKVDRTALVQLLERGGACGSG